MTMKSIEVSEFDPLSQNDAHTPLTKAIIQSQSTTGSCRNCRDSLEKVTSLRKRQIELQYDNQKLKEQIQALKKENQQLVKDKTLSYEQYERKMDKKDLFKREDLEAELFEAKLLVELMQVARATIVPDMKQKMETTLLDNLRLQEKVMLRDRVIAGHGLFPIYHYDQRVLALRQAVAYWHHQAENKCEIIKNECIRMRKQTKTQMLQLQLELASEMQQQKYTIKDLISQQLLRRQPALSHIELKTFRSRIDSEKLKKLKKKQSVDRIAAKKITHKTTCLR